MKCLNCNSNTVVLRVKATLKGSRIRRRRGCISCNRQFTTIEDVGCDEVIGWWERKRVTDGYVNRQERWQAKKQKQGLCVCCGKKDISEGRISLCDVCGEKQADRMRIKLKVKG